MTQSDSPKTPPVAPKKPVTRETHGISFTDDYHWLRDDNWQEVMRDPSVLQADIRTYLEAENVYTEALLAHTQPLQDALFVEMKGRIKEDDSSVPSPDGAFAYYTSYVVGGQHPRMCRQARDGTGEVVLLDGDGLAEGKAFFEFGGMSHSPDHKLVAWSADEKGSEFCTLRIRNIAEGKDLEDQVDDVAGGASWSNDSCDLFYSKLDENHRPSTVYRHRVGTDQAQDELIYEEADPGFFVDVGATQSRRFMVISASDHQSSEHYLIDTEAPAPAPVLISARQPEIEYDVEHQNDRLLILTNVDDAEDFKIVEAPVGNPEPANWRDLVPHKPGRLILSHTAFKDFMVRLEREDGLPRIVITEAASGDEHAISFDEEAYGLGLSAGYEYNTDWVRFTYSSMTTPAQVYDYNMRTRERVLRKTQEIPSGHDVADYVTRRIMAPSHDGELVPVSILYHKDTKLDGSAPCHLYGYGAYGMAMPASFSTTVLSIVDRGFVHAIAHVRGGKERGYGWYKKGRLEHKENTFKDFIAAGEALFSDEYKFTSPGKIIARGGSAGGMLMGAVANMAPHLFGGIIAQVPFVDVLTTMLDDTLPLTPPEWNEWGNPVASPEAYKTIAGYSPYDNVEAKDYPPILITAGLTDPRVTYWEPAKWCAKLRDLKTDDNLLLLKTNMDAGHGGASGRFDSLKETAEAYAFALEVAG
ncbi:MAG: S9 family peptidase [Alphaproteobacteria bacterium]|nr:S9 family peptidase [Alphaproteobacteria bacterium]